MKSLSSAISVLCLLATLAPAATATAQDWTPAVRLDPMGYAVINIEVAPVGPTLAFSAFRAGAFHLFIVDETGAPHLVTGAGLPVAGQLRFEFTPDGSHILYNDVLDNLYGVPVDLSAPPVQLSAPLVAGGSINKTHYISSDGARLVYRADQDTLGVLELYSVPVDGSAAPVKLNGPLVSGGDVRVASISPDGRTVIFIADQVTHFVTELYRVPIDGSSAPVRVNPPLVAGGAVITAVVSPDGSKIIYRADQETDNLYELYAAPIGGGTPLKFSSGNVSTIYPSPDGQFVAWTNGTTLLIAPTAGGATRVLNTTSTSTANVTRVNEVQFTPDSQHVVWQQALLDDDLDSRPPPVENGENELRSVPIGGTAANNVLLATCHWILDEGFIDFKCSSDSSYVVYDNRNCPYIWSVSVSGGLPTPLTPSIPGRLADYGGRRPDASRKIHAFYTESDSSGLYDSRLFQVLIDGGKPAHQISPSATPTTEGVTHFRVDPSGRHVVYKLTDGANSGTYSTFRIVRLDTLAPATGPAAGGTIVWLRGEGFSDETEVFFGATPATATLMISEEVLLAIAPPTSFAAPAKRLKRAARLVDVTIRNVGTQSSISRAFAYVK